MTDWQNPNQDPNQNGYGQGGPSQGGPYQQNGEYWQQGQQPGQQQGGYGYGYQQPAYQPQPSYYQPPAQGPAPMTLGDWVITLILCAIPVVNIIMLIIWAASSSTDISKKHFAQAYLIILAIEVAVVVVMTVAGIGTFSSLLSSSGYSGYMS